MKFPTVVHLQKSSQQEEGDYRSGFPAQRGAALHDCQHGKAQQQGHHDILLHIEQLPGGEKTVGDDGQNRSQGQPEGIFLLVVGVIKSFYQQKTENGEGDPTDAAAKPV